MRPSSHSKTSHISSSGALTLAALGVVYGDIGTSPLYTLKTVFLATTGILPTAENIIGAVSVIFWSLMFVVTLKYVTLILRADNKGEGGIMALLALAARAVQDRPILRRNLLLLGTFGACLFYGDSVLTPAISVLSAVEGLSIAQPSFKHWVLPVCMGILIGLFMVQKRGTSTMGRWFGPVMALWFMTLAVIGLWHIIKTPLILHALDPRHAMVFLSERGWGIFVALGAIVLALTGAEALYADMGHFGKRPIRLAWMRFVLPALALNYMGQGALMLHDARTVDNPFYLLFPDFLLIPAVVLATLATVIASQAVITGAYSLTQQAIQLGFIPRLRIIHTSGSEKGQIYIPVINWFLLGTVMLVCVGFRESAAMTAAYGIAVTGTMLIASILTYYVVRYAWNFPLWVSLGATMLFIVTDIALVLGCSIKIAEGGWFPILLAVFFLVLMTTWKRGREMLRDAQTRDALPLNDFIQSLEHSTDLVIVPRTAVYLTVNIDQVPQALLHNLKHNLVLHERNIMLNVVIHDEAWIAKSDQIEVERLGQKFWRVTLNFGFMNQPHVTQALQGAAAHGLEIEEFSCSYFLGRDTILPSKHKGAMMGWRQNLFETMSRNAERVTDFYALPYNLVIELGTRVRL